MSIFVNESTFKSIVLDSDLPVLAHFWAPWCSLCKMIMPLLNQFQADWEGQVRLVDINADENLRLANTYRLSTLPTLLLLDQGEVRQRLDTFRGKEDLRLTLDTFMQSQALVYEELQPVRIYPKF
ncbi:MAG: thioredoxin family protein [Nodosilinea sp.]